MKTSDGGLYFGSGIDTAGLLSDSEKIKRELKSIGSSAETEGSRIDNSFKNIAAAAAGIFTIQAATGFITKIAQVRGEFQQLEVAFSTILKSKDKADKLMGEAVKLAAITPFTLQDVSTGAKQLLAYGFGADSITKNLTMLGNVASGVSAPLGDIVYLYGTLQTQGRAYTRDIMQFTSRGIPMIDELSKVMGVGKEQVQGLVEAGKVGFPQVEKAMQNMTKDGGMFFNLMEEQSKTITGKISNLSDAFSRMYNDIGKSNQGIISGALDTTIDLVNNYQEVGKNIEALIVTFGAYKAALITLNAIQRATASAKYADEGASLMQLLTVEQKAIISKQNLTVGSAEHVAAVRAEAMAEMERQTQLAVTTQKEILLSTERLSLRQKEQISAEQAVIARKLELETSISALTSEKSIAIAKEISIASEIKSREALQIAMLNERKAAMLNEVTALEQTKSSGIVIAAKRAEIVAIDQKISASNAEIFQQEKYIVAKRAEIASIEGGVVAKRTEKAQNALNLAIQEANTASIEKNAIARTVSSQKAVIDTAVRRANTIETGINTAAQNANIVGTNLLTLAKERLAAASIRLNAFMAANPYALVAAGVALMAFSVYKAATAMSQAEIAQKKLDEATNDYNASVITEQIEIETLFAKLKNTTKGTHEYDEAKKAIMSKYGYYLKGLGDEKHALDDVALAYKTITDEATKAAKARAMQNFSDQASKDLGDRMKSISESLQNTLEEKYIAEFGERYGKKKAAQVFQQLAPYLAGRKDVDETISKLIKSFDVTLTSTQSSFGTGGGQRVHNNLQVLLDQSKEANGLFKQTIEQATSIFTDLPEPKSIIPEKELTNLEKYNKQVKEARQNLEDLKQKQDDLVNLRVVPDNYAAEKEANKKAIAEAQATLDNLLNKPTKKESKEVETEAQKRAKAQEEVLKADQEFQRKQIDLQYNYEQERINLMDDSIQKEQDQNRLNYNRKIEELKRQSEDELAMLRKKVQDEYEAKGGKGIAPNLDKVELPKSYTDMIAKMKSVYEDTMNKANDKALKDRIDKYKDYDQKRQDIDKRYTDELAELENSNINGKNDNAIKQLARDWNKELTELQNSLLKDLNLLDLYTGSGSELIMKKIKDTLPLFTDLSHATLSELNKIKSIISEFELSPELIAQLETAGIDVAKLKAELEKAKKASTNATDERRWEILDKSIGKVASSLSQLGQTMLQSGGKMAALGRIISTLAGSYQALAENIHLAAKSSEELTSEDKATMAANAINAVGNIYSMIANQVAENKRAQEEWNATIAEGVQRTRLMRIETDAYKQSNIFGVENPYARAIAGAKQYGDSMAELQKMAGDLGGGQVQTGTRKAVSGQNIATGAAAGAVIGSVIPGLGSAVGAVVGSVVGGIVGLFSRKTVPVFESLKNKYKEIYDKDTFEINPAIMADYDKLDDATKKLVDNWEEIKNKAKAAQEEMSQTFKDLAGDIGKNLSDALVNAFKNGNVYGAMNDFHKYMTGIIENIISQMIFAKTMQPYFDELDKRMNKSMAQGGDGSITDDLEWFYSAIQGGLNNYNQAMSQAQTSSKGTGFPLFTGSGSSTSQSAASTGSFQSMSQDTGNALEGRFTALQMISSNMEGLLKSIQPDVSSIRVSSGLAADSLRESRNIALESMNHLADINKNTKELYEMKETLIGIKKGTDKL